MRTFKMTVLCGLAAVALSGCGTVNNAVLAMANATPFGLGQAPDSTLQNVTAQWLQDNDQPMILAASIQILNRHNPEMMKLAWTADTGNGNRYSCIATYNMGQLANTTCRPNT